MCYLVWMEERNREQKEREELGEKLGRERGGCKKKEGKERGKKRELHRNRSETTLSSSPCFLLLGDEVFAARPSCPCSPLTSERWYHTYGLSHLALHLWYTPSKDLNSGPQTCLESACTNWAISPMLTFKNLTATYDTHACNQQFEN